MSTVREVDLRDGLPADVLAEVAESHGEQRVLVRRHGRPIAVVLSLEEFERLEGLVEYFEDYVDAAEADRAFEEAGDTRIPWEAVKQEFGL